MKLGLISTPFLSTPCRNYGGAEMVLWNIANGLTTNGHKVVLFATDESQAPKNGFLVKCGKEIGTVQVDWFKAEKDMWENYKQYINPDNFDLVLGSNWFGFEYASKSIHPSLNVAHLHHGGLNDVWLQSKPPFKTNLISISRWMKKVYQSQGYESQVCYNPVDTNFYKYQEEKGDRFLFVGRVDKFKRSQTAIEACKRLNVGLDIVGGSFVQDMGYLNHIKSLCDGEQIKLHLDASHEEKIKLYQNAKATMFPSRMGEPFGLISIESMSCGTWVIGMNDGAIPEVITPESGEVVGRPSDGTITLEEDVNAVVQAIRNLEKNGYDPKKCRARAEDFSIPKCVARYEELFNQIISGYNW